MFNLQHLTEAVSAGESDFVAVGRADARGLRVSLTVETPEIVREPPKGGIPCPAEVR